MKSSILTKKIPAHIPEGFSEFFTIKEMSEFKNLDLVLVEETINHYACDSSGGESYFANLGDFGIKWGPYDNDLYEIFIRQYYAWKRGFAPRPLAMLEGTCGKKGILTEVAEELSVEPLELAAWFSEFRKLKDPFGKGYYGRDCLLNPANLGIFNSKIVCIDFGRHLISSQKINKDHLLELALEFPFPEKVVRIPELKTQATPS